MKRQREMDIQESKSKEELTERNIGSLSTKEREKERKKERKKKERKKEKMKKWKKKERKKGYPE